MELLLVTHGLCISSQGPLWFKDGTFYPPACSLKLGVTTNCQRKTMQTPFILLRTKNIKKVEEEGRDHSWFDHQALCGNWIFNNNHGCWNVRGNLLCSLLAPESRVCCMWSVTLSRSYVDSPNLLTRIRWFYMFLEI